MREATRAQNWSEEPESGMNEQMDGIGDSMDRLEASVGGPTETELVTVSLLMRLYDLNLAILNHLDENRANEIYEAHEKGLHFNPPIFVPEVEGE